MWFSLSTRKCVFCIHSRNVENLTANELAIHTIASGMSVYEIWKEILRNQTALHTYRACQRRSHTHIQGKESNNNTVEKRAKEQTIFYEEKKVLPCSSFGIVDKKIAHKHTIQATTFIITISRNDELQSILLKKTIRACVNESNLLRCDYCKLIIFTETKRDRSRLRPKKTKQKHQK